MVVNAVLPRNFMFTILLVFVGTIRVEERREASNIFKIWALLIYLECWNFFTCSFVTFPTRRVDYDSKVEPSHFLNRSKSLIIVKTFGTSTFMALNRLLTKTNGFRFSFNEFYLPIFSIGFSRWDITFQLKMTWPF